LIPEKMPSPKDGWFAKTALGFVVAATGVGAGDVITGGIAGSKFGIVLAWVALAGAAVKFLVAEGIARWQMATGTTILEGWIARLGRAIRWIFFVYFLFWSYSVGGALISACGVAGVGLFPLGGVQTSKVVWGVFHSLLGFGIVWAGGFRVFQKVMAFLTATMFVTVLATAVLIRPDWLGLVRSLVRPNLPPGSTAWVLGVLGGVGGTVTLLSYGYWIREKNRSGRAGLKACRFDLRLGYFLTGFFGAAMVLIGSRIVVEGEGATVALALADQLGRVLGPAGRWIFLWGFWGAVFSSLLGVWQSVPYLFVDFLRLKRGGAGGAGDEDLSKTAAYRAYLAALTFVPLHMLWFKVQEVQIVYAVLGAFFMPFLALTLLLLNTRRAWVGEFRNRWPVNAALALTLALFVYLGFKEIVESLL
jgi:Mn2+/Fe2+ NRAMP family transporter